MTIHVVGNLCFDTTLEVPRFPVAGETLVALSGRSDLGGKGGNQAVAAARAGATVMLHAAVGTADAEAIAARLAVEDRLGVRLVTGEGPSDGSTILVRPDGENMIVSTIGCAQRFEPEAPFEGPDAIAAGDILLMQGNMRATTTATCLAAARKRGATTMFNPSPLWDASPALWGDVDWLVLNAGELKALSGEDDSAEGAAIMLARGVGALAVTLGRRGAFIIDAAARYDARAPDVAVHDTTGAGDVFCGVLAAGLAAGLDRGQALGRAVAAASLSVTRPGALASCPSADEMAALVAQTITRSLR